ncbi:peroxiredoxin-like family protein [Shewanella livingstonensis]|uniref:thioredoxin-dependent peroxiredoxin n=1 Tax=Shewanella livingstonensis TaxID=150120 RepID=A0A3G8LWS9_9GAMM|nr:peroxiredoxin-like family protein [Shewanella livingstonensis]AZG74116.1 AhpC/TSA family protein [Shewanella livingstonensis]
MSLSAQLTEKRDATKANLPAQTLAIMSDATLNLKLSGIIDSAPKAGDKLAEFSLINSLGETRHLADLLAKGPLVVTFYRGGWCPYCNLALRAYQQHLAEFKQLGATLVAITPELPDMSLSTAQKNELEFDVLSDVNAEYARQLGLVFSLPESVRELYQNFGVEVEKHNGADQFDFPLAATFVVAKDGIIAKAFVDADYTYRLAPEDIISSLKAL